MVKTDDYFDMEKSAQVKKNPKGTKCNFCGKEIEYGSWCNDDCWRFDQNRNY